MTFLKTALMAGIAAVAWTGAAHATLITIAAQQTGMNGGAITAVATDSGSGYATIAGGYGSFTFNSVTATGSPLLTQPNFQTTSVNISSGAAGVITLYITEQGLTSPVGINNFLSSFTSQTFSATGITSVVESTYIDTANGLYGGTQLASATFTGLSTSAVVAATPSLTTYSETVKYVITATGAGNVNDTITITAVPEPVSLSLLGAGLVGLGMIRRRKAGRAV